ncbi:MAG: cupin-like domain-containing protein [Myxococcota bacterium]
MNAFIVPRVRRASDRTLFGRAVPTILEGGAADWPAVHRWTWSWLRRRAGAVRVPVRSPDGGRRARRLESVIRRFSSRDYIVDWTFCCDAPDLAADVRTPHFAMWDWMNSVPERVRPVLRWLYIGGAGTGSSLHQDVLGTHAWLAQLRGRKDWVLYPPDTFTAAEAATHDAFSRGAEATDSLARRTRWVAELCPGDVIFVPSLWWHQVQNPGPSMGLTGNFVNESNYSRVRDEAARGRFRAIVPYLDAVAARRRAPRSTCENRLSRA